MSLEREIRELREDKQFHRAECILSGVIGFMIAGFIFAAIGDMAITEERCKIHLSYAKTPIDTLSVIRTVSECGDMVYTPSK